MRKQIAIALLAMATALGVCAADIQRLNSGKTLPPGLPFPEAVRVGDMLYLSGQVGVVPGSLELVAGGMSAQARQTMLNIQSVLQSQGLDMNNLVKCQVMLADIAEWGAFNEVYRSFFETHFPARSAFGANGLALGARVELECMAAY